MRVYTIINGIPVIGDAILCQSCGRQLILEDNGRMIHELPPCQWFQTIMLGNTLKYLLTKTPPVHEVH